MTTAQAHRDPARPARRELFGYWFTIGGILIVLQAAMAYLSRRGADAAAESWQFTGQLILLMILAGFFYVYLVRFLLVKSPGGLICVWIALAGLIMRGVLFFSPPALTGDMYRHLWDGAVVAHRMNPYALSPERIRRAGPGGDDVVSPALAALAEEAAGIIDRIPQPDQPSRQPPAAQGLFCAAYWLRPLDPVGWRIVLLGFDGLAAGGVLLLLASTRRELSYFSLYFWNPLLLFETYLHGHPDLVAAGLVVTAVFFLVQGHRVMAAAALVLAAGVCLWPLLLAPFLVFGAPSGRRAKVLALLVFVAVATLWLVSYRVDWLDPAAGGWSTGGETTPFATGVFWPIQRVCRQTQAAGWEPISGDLLGGGVVAGMLLLSSLLLAGVRPASGWALCLRLGWWIMLLLLLSPAASAWHYLAVIPLAAVVPRWGFLCWTLLLPLGYLPPEIFADRQEWIWLLHVPVWLLLARELARSLRKSTARQAAALPGSCLGREDTPSRG